MRSTGHFSSLRLSAWTIYGIQASSLRQRDWPTREDGDEQMHPLHKMHSVHRACRRRLHTRNNGKRKGYSDWDLY